MIKLSAFADEIDKDLGVQISVLKKHGISLFELRSIDGVNVKDFSNISAKNYKRQIEDAGMGVWAIGSPLGKVDISVDFYEYLEMVKRVFEIANIFETDKIRAFSFFNAYKEKEKVFDYLNKMAEVAKSFGVTLYHENEKDIYGDNLERVIEIMQNVKGWKFVYDPANFIQVGERATSTLPALIQKTDYFHIKDVIASTGELVPAGQGNGDIEGLINGISKDTVLSIEPHLAVFEGYAEIDKSEMKNKYVYKSNIDAFNHAAYALKNLLNKCGYKEEKGVFVK